LESGYSLVSALGHTVTERCYGIAGGDVPLSGVRKLWGESGTTWPPFPSLPVETGAKFARERAAALLHARMAN
jgi:hypothetical protein